MIVIMQKNWNEDDDDARKDETYGEDNDDNADSYGDQFGDDDNEDDLGDDGDIIVFVIITITPYDFDVMNM